MEPRLSFAIAALLSTALISTGCATSGASHNGLGGAAAAEKHLGQAAGDVPPDIRQPCVPTLKPGSKDAAIADLGLQVIACDEKRARAVTHVDNGRANLEPAGKPST
jgi:hypothetical protein